ncbi:MAG: sterol desaturase family protein [Rhodobacteraceae bacterium]|nr:sterol desaturase family protein [Paracoccaceae bacterium]
MSDASEDFEIGREGRKWNHHPGEVRLNPLFAWPPQPMSVLRWYANYWLAVTTTTVTVLAAIVGWLIFLPPLEAMVEWRWSWVLRVWLSNLIPHALCAGLLHIWLYRWRQQDLRWKFEARGQTQKSSVYTFKNQIHDNMFWSIASGITLWTAFQAPVYWAMANGYAPVIHPAENPAWFIAVFPILVVWSSLHFYWVHRLLHVPFFYTHAHALHHRNVNVGPWSGISMHPLEHLLFYTNFAIHFVVASHPIHVLFHGYMQSIHPVFSHSGFEWVEIGDKRRAKAGDFFHQLHHRYFECNYGTVEMPWDRWFGTFHDGSEQGSRDTVKRKAKMYGS